MENNNEMSISKLWKDFRKFLELELDYVKLTATEKLTIILSSIAVVSLIIILGGLVLFYLSFALTYLLGSWFGNMAISFLVIGGLLLILLCILYVMRKRLILDPIAKFISKLFLDPPKK